MWDFDSSGKIVGMNLDNIPKEKYTCHRCHKDYICAGHKSLCIQCLLKNDNRGVYLLVHLVTGDMYVGKSRTLSSRIIEHVFRGGGGSIQVAKVSADNYCLWLFVQLSTNMNDEGWWIEELKPSLNRASSKNKGIKDLETALASKDALGDQAYLLDNITVALEKVEERQLHN